MVHGHVEWAAKQLFPDLSDEEQLLRQAAMYGIAKTAATFAGGLVDVEGDDGSVIPVDEILKYADGRQYRCVAEVTIAGGVGSLEVEAVEAGAAGNLEAGEPLTFDNAPPGVVAGATVAVGGIVDGVDEGSIENVRARLFERLRQPPEAGADHDYIGWTLAVPGVTRAWVSRHELGLGTLVVRFVLDGEADIFPTGGKVAEVQAALDAQRPTTAEPTAMAPVELAQDFDIRLTPDTTALRDAVRAELADLMAREGRPGDGLGAGTILYSRIHTAIGASGVDDYQLISPAEDVVPALGELVTVGVITWV